MTVFSRPRDTAVEAWEFQLSCYRGMTGETRAGLLIQLNEAAQSFCSAGRGKRHVTMNPSQHLLFTVAQGLEAAQVPYMVVGSFASAYHGIPRTTQDLDIVAAFDVNSLEHLLATLSQQAYYLSREAAQDAVARKSQFNLIDPRTGWKVDFILPKDREFSRGELGRRQRAQIEGCQIFIASPEDTILSKLEWAKESLSERQLRDVAGILDVCGEHLDYGYIDAWVETLELTEVYSKARGPW